MLEYKYNKKQQKERALQFENFKNKEKVPFVIDADLESILEK